jgi:hypothetical protein
MPSFASLGHRVLRLDAARRAPLAPVAERQYLGQTKSIPPRGIQMSPRSISKASSSLFSAWRMAACGIAYLASACAAAPASDQAMIRVSESGNGNSNDQAFDWHSPKPTACVARSNTSDLTASSTSSSSTNATSAVIEASSPDSGARASTTSRAVGNAAQVIADMRAAFRSCFQELLARDRLAEGTVRLNFLVDCEGTVTSIHAAAHGVDRETVGCMFTRVAKSRFAPPEGGWARIQVPVTFVRENAARPD